LVIASVNALASMSGVAAIAGSRRSLAVAEWSAALAAIVSWIAPSMAATPTTTVATPRTSLARTQ
jgi:hypothetical protein